jgi:SAM-dependent methyltransferase
MGHASGDHAHPGHASASDEAWQAATWPFIRDQLPPSPASVIELGCGPLGGHVPALLRAGYRAVGVDPEAPEAPDAPEDPAYLRIAFEDYRPDAQVDAVIASVSLHHVHDPAAALEHVADLLVPGGTLIVIEWISEDLDEPTARWCFLHRPADGPDSWLAQMQANWAASRLPWGDFFRAWLDEHGLHAAADIRRELEARFVTTHLSTGPHYFPDLLDADESAEQAAIDSGQLNPGCLRYAGRRDPDANPRQGDQAPDPVAER